MHASAILHISRCLKVTILSTSEKFASWRNESHLQKTTNQCDFTSWINGRASVFLGCFHLSLPSGHWGNPCVSRALRSCSADPLLQALWLSPPSSCHRAHCCSQTSTALSLIPAVHPCLHGHLRSSSASFSLTPVLEEVPPTGPGSSEEVGLHFSPLQLCLPESSSPCCGSWGSAALGQGDQSGDPPTLHPPSGLGWLVQLDHLVNLLHSGGFLRSPVCLFIDSFRDLLPPGPWRCPETLTCFKFSTLPRDLPGHQR